MSEVKQRGEGDSKGQGTMTAGLRELRLNEPDNKGLKQVQKESK